MTYKVMRVVLLCLAAFVALASVSGQSASGQSDKASDYKPLIGTWNMTSETSGDPVKWTLVLKEEDGKLAGQLTTDGGPQPAKNFTYSGGVVKFVAPYQGADYDIQIKLDGSKLDGTWSGGGDSGRTSGTRS
jgi:hypothetical protein